MDELNTIYNEIKIKLDFLIKISNNSKYKIMEDIIEKEYKNNKISQLNRINKDMNEWISTLSEEHRLELNKLLENKNDLYHDNINLTIDSILKRNKIDNEDEYRMVLETVDKLAQSDNPSVETIEKLNKLLIDFHKNN